MAEKDGTPHYGFLNPITTQEGIQTMALDPKHFTDPALQFIIQYHERSNNSSLYVKKDELTYELPTETIDHQPLGYSEQIHAVRASGVLYIHKAPPVASVTLPVRLSRKERRRVLRHQMKFTDRAITVIQDNPNIPHRIYPTIMLNDKLLRKRLLRFMRSGNTIGITIQPCNNFIADPNDA